MKANDIEKYLAQLGRELAGQGVEKPVRVLRQKYSASLNAYFSEAEQLFEQV